MFFFKVFGAGAGAAREREKVRVVKEVVNKFEFQQ